MSLRSYWRVSRAPRYSLVFAFPLLVAYQILAGLQPSGPHGPLRNGADVILETLFVALIGPWGPTLLIAAVIGGGAWVVARDLRGQGRRLVGTVFVGMTLETLCLALSFGTVVATLTSQLVRPPALLVHGRLGGLAWQSRLMLSLGAGIYEELLFRVVVVSGLAWLARRVFGWGPGTAGALAVGIGACVFSAAHYIGPYGDRLTLYSFAFRMVAGVAFSALYLLRGFGITAWTHALYDVFLLVV